jgi:transmembrane sensor
MKTKFDDRAWSEAAEWFARLRASDCSPEDQTAFEAWCGADPSNAEAYAYAELTSAAVDELITRDPRLQALLDEAVVSPSISTTETVANAGAARAAPAWPAARHWKIPAALAASVMLAIGLASGVQYVRRDLAPIVYETTNVRQTVTLEDGSRIELDVGTKLAVTFSSDRRQVKLESGRALFDVARDRQRPFSVVAANSRTTALGTQFQVHLRDAAVVVTLTEGAVAVDNAGSTKSWQEHLRPGERLEIDLARATRIKHTIDTSVATSWSRGRLMFRGTPLAEAVEEINRYSAKKIRLGDPSLAELPVGGNFIAGDSDLIVDALAAVLPLRIVRGGEHEIILVRRYDGAQS